MDKKTEVILITGFLGSGKTTFLNNIIDTFPAGLKLTILMNEFGEIGVDGTLVKGEAIDMLEISRGSIFCVCVKTDFIKGLYELNSRSKPDLLIIESTGVANPADLKRDLKLSIFQDRFEFTEQFCIIDAAHFLEAFEIFASVEKQLSTSTYFIINKTDLVSAAILEEIKDLVREHHPDPTFFETIYSEIPHALLGSLNLPNTGRQAALHSPADILSPQELEDFIGTVLENPDRQSTPPDQLASVTYVWQGSDLHDLETMAESLPEGIVRVKGFLIEDTSCHLFSYVMGDWTLSLSDRNAEEIKQRNMLVFIGTFEAVNALTSSIDAESWSSREILQPSVQIDIL